MKKILLSLTLVFSLSAFAQKDELVQSGIHFEHGTWKELLAQAKKENKLIMLDGYTTWCGPCKWMVKNIFPLKEVGDFYNKNFINAKIDMEKGEGIDIAKTYEVQAYPTYLFVDGSGNLVHRLCGSMEAADFIKSGKEALNPETALASLKKNYLAHDKDAEIALKYFTAADKACMKADAEVMKYLSAQKPETYLDKANYNLIINFVSDYKHASFKYLLSNYKTFTDTYSKDEIDAKILNVFKTSVLAALKTKNEKELTLIQKTYRKEAHAPAARLDIITDLTKAKLNKDTAAYFKAVVAHTNGFLMNDASALNSSAWDFYEKTNSVAYLQKAESWAKKSIELYPGYFNHDTYAAVLYKLGKYPEAKLNAEKAIEMGKKEGSDVKETEELLAKINEKLKA